MGMDVQIDQFTPCLKDTQTGELVDTVFAQASRDELKALKGWNFDWTADDLSGAEVYKLMIRDSDEIQGLVAVTKFDRDKALYVNIVESAPHNLGNDKQYSGVGGHLFAVAAKRSVDLGYGGFLFMDAKNTDLVQHYADTLGASFLGRPHPYRMYMDEIAAKHILDMYTFEEA